MNKYTQTYLKNNDKNLFDKNSEYINPFLLDQSNPFSCPKPWENACPKINTHANIIKITKQFFILLTFLNATHQLTEKVSKIRFFTNFRGNIIK